MRGEVVIVVPLYRREMDAFERISWLQLKRLLGRYPIRVVAPSSMAVDTQSIDDVPVIPVGDAHFRSVQSYSRMMLDAAFYQRFSSYAYMLVYQLDAFVFSDRLHEFCAMGYDYIGAPWPRSLARHFPAKGGRVGNGGFSLRNISSACRILGHRDEILSALPDSERKTFLDAEDLFWAYCSTLPALHFSVPSVTVARTFSEEFRREKNATEKLPFGCHGWSRYGYLAWRDIITSYGYDVPPYHGVTAWAMRWNAVRDDLLQRLLPSERRGAVLTKALACIPSSRRLILWGWGAFGRRINVFLMLGNRAATMIWDQANHGMMTKQGIIVRAPELDKLQKSTSYILVSTLRYEDEICELLKTAGWREGQDFGRASVLRDEICKAYLRSFGNGDGIKQ